MTSTILMNMAMFFATNPQRVPSDFVSSNFEPTTIAPTISGIACVATKQLYEEHVSRFANSIESFE